jgi:phosphatidylglycerophosphate synthase
MSPANSIDVREAEPEAVRWKRLVEEPTNRFLYYPIAKGLVRLLVKTPITANQVTLVQPLIAAVAGYLISFGDWRYMALGALTFELRSLLDCVDGSLARAKKTSSPNGHALDALCDWLGVVFLYGGIYAHFLFNPPPVGGWSAYLPMGAVIGLALFQGAMRSFAHDYFMRKFGSILETGRDETVEDLRDKQRALRPDSPFMAKAEAWIGRCQHLSFQLEYFDVERSKSISGEQAQLFAAQRGTGPMKLIQWLWSISNGDAFIRISVVAVLLGHSFLWELMLFWAGIGFAWIVAAMLLTSWFVKRATERTAEPLQV